LLIFGCFRIGAAGIVVGLPLLLYIFAFGCNDISGCPAPSLLNLKTLSLESLKAEVGWPENGICGLASWEATGWVFAYYIFNAVLYRVLPAKDVEGTELVSGGKLTYRMNGEKSCPLFLLSHGN
jgi:delta14-sterol reductase